MAAAKAKVNVQVGVDAEAVKAEAKANPEAAAALRNLFPALFEEESPYLIMTKAGAGLDLGISVGGHSQAIQMRQTQDKKLSGRSIFLSPSFKWAIVEDPSALGLCPQMVLVASKKA